MEANSNAVATEQQDAEPVRLPSRFWTAVDFGLMTKEAALEEWLRQQRAGVVE